MTLARRIAVAICFLLLLSLMVVFTLCYFLLPAEFGALLREYMGLLLQIGLAVMLVAALLVWRLCLHQFGPLTTLVALMNTVRDRPRLDSDVLPGDEIAALFKSFNQLVDELRVHRQAMSALVVEGSAEMADANQEMQAMNQMLEDTNRHLLQENRARRESEDRLRRRERQYRAISGLLAWADGRNVFEMILQSAVQLLGANNGFIGLFDEEKQKFHIQHGIGIDAELIGEALPARIGLKWQVHASGELMYVEDYRRYTGRLENEKLEAIISVVMLPLKVDGIVRGILGISWIDDVHFIEADDLGALRQFGDLASVALERELHQQQIRHMAYHDSLTGLLNRAGLREHMDQEMVLAQSAEAAGAVLLIDIDNLKTINDNFGHPEGDAVILAVSRQITAAAGPEAVVARLGGDEFVVVVRGILTNERAAELVEKIRCRVSKEYAVADEEIYMSVSIGVVLYPRDGAGRADTLKKADLAMYAAKQGGKNRWLFYEPKMLQDSYDRMTMTNALRRGIAEKAFYLCYQPQLNTAGDRIVGFEALLRWNNEVYGTVSPAEYIPAAEHTGLIVPLGQWILREACCFARRLSDRGETSLRVAVNISPRQLLSDSFVADVTKSIGAAGISPTQLELEITENVFIESMAVSVDKLQLLRAMGVRIALDDFGTGYSSLTYLRRLPVDVLKIDKTFIDKIVEDSEGFCLVGSVIEIGHGLHLKIVAEGVEAADQVALLRRSGCDYLQGYFFSPPLPETEAFDFLPPAVSVRLFE